MSDHAWVQENLDAYLAGGLSLEERDRLEGHVAGCDACVSALAAAQKLDRTLAALFAPVRPDAALEDRAIQKLRSARPRRRSLALRFLGAAAAVIVMGGLGVVVQALAADGGLPFPGMERTGRVVSTNNLSDIDGKIRNFFALETNDSLPEPQGFAKKEKFSVVDVDLAATEYDANVNYMADRIADVRVPGSVKPNEAVGIMNSDKSAPAVGLLGKGAAGAKPSQLGLGTGTLGVYEIGKDAMLSDRGFQDLDGSISGSPWNYIGKGKEWAESERLTRDLGEAANGRKAGGAGAGGDALAGVPLQGSFYGRSGVTRESELRREVDGEYYRRLDDAGKATNRPPFPAITGLSLPSPTPTAAGGSSPSSSAGVPAIKPQESKPAEWSSRVTLGFEQPLFRDGYFKPGDDASRRTPLNTGSNATATGTIAVEIAKKEAERLTEPPADPLVAMEKKLIDDARIGLNKDGKPAMVGEVIISDAAPPPAPLQQPPKQLDPPVDPARKIIRTGELEFEIDSFDKAVANVATLINAVKGGFVATVNSDKLPNGKVRGSVVVRMPPQFLDKFLLDLRKELGKVGELKTQRIGSQDVTKAYTDIESRLKAARTMEERFLAIIKNGKGEVKDLIAAERELGVWRTKIEEMEGEIRYFNNQVGLSTLTISLTEKEIQAAAAVVITERVGMRIEVEDVEKAHIDALKAVAEDKGRITKSELKQHPAGQLEAVLQVEVAPEKAKKLRDVFKKLGLVTFNDVQRVQQAVGGGKVGEFEGKLKQADVQIHVTLYDTANIQPRESVTMLIATDDVQASYRALQAAVVKAKGQIRVGQLREPEKITINAEFNFDVPSPEKPGIDTILAKLGVILSSTDVQVPIQETATDRKHGYRLVLRNLATVPARETSILRIAVNDVPTVFREMQDAVLAAKGVIHVQQLNVASKLSVDAVLSFDVPKSDRQAFDKVLAKLGMVLSSTSTKAPANEITTDRKFGFKLDLINLDSVRPKEIFTIELVTNDVRANFQELRDAVTTAKGLLYLDRLNEDTPQQPLAKLDFDVDSAKRSDIDKLLAKAGAVFKRGSNQASVNEVSSDKRVGFRIVLFSIASIPPRDKATMSIKVDDVKAKAAELAKLVRDNKGQATKPRITLTPQGEMTASLVFDVPIAAEESVLGLCANVGKVVDESQSTNAQVPETDLATAQIVVTLTGGRPTIPSNEGIWEQTQGSLYVTFRVLSWSVMVVMLGLAVVLPWVIAIWICVKIVRKMRGKPQPEGA
jgi:hypothetical protein